MATFNIGDRVSVALFQTETGEVVEAIGGSNFYRVRLDSTSEVIEVNALYLSPVE